MKQIYVSAAVIAGVISNLVNRVTVGSSADEIYVLDAIRRSSGKLSEMSNAEIGDYIGSVNENQLHGLLNNIKGIALENHVVGEENSDGDSITASQFEATNQPGADVQMFKDGVLVEEFQVKATSSLRYIDEHLSRYPDTPVIATSEVAWQKSGLVDAGITNRELTEQVESTFDELTSLGAIEQAVEAGAAGGLLGGLLTAKALLNGEVNAKEAAKTTALSAAVAGSSSLIIDILLG
ncbi:MAG: hypothetical protein JKY93_12370 [Gammaproteobacteria bacterium]|nr:hypothetical protein [Gammaproteobacteria bacterium]